MAPVTPARRTTFLAAAVGAAVLAGCGGGDGEGDDGLPDLQPDVRVYDVTGNSLDPSEVDDLNAQAEQLTETIGAEVVLVVRELDADPDETADQVEDLHREWAAALGDPEQTEPSAVAFLINREPGDATSARAGVFAGSFFTDADVSDSELSSIVEDALIPPLREAAVADSFAAGMTAFEQAATTPETPSSLRTWAASATTVGGWVTWIGVVLAALMALGGAALDRRRARGPEPAPSPTLVRPDDLPAALGASLALADPAPSGQLGTLLELARDGAIEVQARSSGDTSGTDSTAGTDADVDWWLHLGSPEAITDPLGAELWERLRERGDAAGWVEPEGVREVMDDVAPHHEVVRAVLAERGWADPAARRRRFWLNALWLSAFVLTLPVVMIAITGGSWWPTVSVVALALAGAVTLRWSVRQWPFSGEGAARAAPWAAYRAGLNQARKPRADTQPAGATADALAEPDALAQVLPDVVALGLDSAWNARLSAAEKAGVTVPYLGGRNDVDSSAYLPGIVVALTALHGPSATSGTSTTTVTSSSGAGAAGST